MELLGAVFFVTTKVNRQESYVWNVRCKPGSFARCCLVPTSSVSVVMMQFSFFKSVQGRLPVVGTV